jgi:hypothetical protein
MSVPAVEKSGHYSDAPLGYRRFNGDMEKVCVIFKRTAEAIVENIRRRIDSEWLEGRSIDVISIPEMEAIIASIEKTPRNDVEIMARQAVRSYFLRSPLKIDPDEWRNINTEEDERAPTSGPMKLLFDAHRFLTDAIAIRVIPLPDSQKNWSCFHYVFHAIGEPYAHLHAWQLPEVLKNMDYHIVPAPQPDDLVLFLNEDGPTHLGIYRGDYLVESKWGCQRPSAYLHRIEDAPAVYGIRVIYYRRPSI